MARQPNYVRSVKDFLPRESRRENGLRDGEHCSLRERIGGEAALTATVDTLVHAFSSACPDSTHRVPVSPCGGPARLRRPAVE